MKHSSIVFFGVAAISALSLSPRDVQAQGAGAEAAQLLKDQQASLQAATSPVAQEQLKDKAAERLEARQGDARMKDDLDRAVSEMKNRRDAAIAKLKAERTAQAATAAAASAKAKADLERAAASRAAAAQAVDKGRDAAASMRRAADKAVDAFEDAEEAHADAQGNFAKASARQASAEKAVAAAQGDKAVAAAKTSAEEARKQASAAQVALAQAVTAREAAAAKRIAAHGDAKKAADALLSLEKDAADKVREFETARQALSRSEDRAAEAEKALANAEKDALNELDRAAKVEREKAKLAARQAEEKKQAEARQKRYREEEAAENAKRQQDAQIAARREQAERDAQARAARAEAEARSQAASKSLEAAKSEKASADKALAAAATRRDEAEKTMKQAADADKQAAAALAAANQTLKTAQGRESQMRETVGQADAAARKAQAAADDARSALERAKRGAAKAETALAAARAVVVKDTKDKKSADAKAAGMAAAERDLAAARAAEAKASEADALARKASESASEQARSRRAELAAAATAATQAKDSVRKADAAAEAAADANKQAASGKARADKAHEQARRIQELNIVSLAKAENSLKQAEAATLAINQSSGSLPRQAYAGQRTISSEPVGAFVPADGDKGPVWPNITSVNLLGDIEFASETGLKSSLSKALVDGKQKSPESVRRALKVYEKELGKAGYYFASLELCSPEYDKETQAINISVSSGKLRNITVDDNYEEGWFSKSQILRRFKGFRPGAAFNYQDLFEKLVEVNSSPDLTLDTHLVQSKVQEGEGVNRREVRYVDVKLTPRESIPFHAIYEVNNYASSALDEWQQSLTLQYVNLTKADDVLTFSPSMTLNADMWSAAGSYMRPHDLGNGGATTLYGGYSELLSEEVVPRLDIEGMGWFSGLVESYRLIDSSDTLLTISGGLLYRYIEDQYTVSDIDLSLQERSVSVVPATVSLSYSDKKPNMSGGRSFATISGIYNLAASGDNELDDLWVGAKERYLVLRLQLAHLHPLFGGQDALERPTRQWTLYARAQGQWSPDPLIPSEKLFVGGYSTVRGYSAKDIPGDNGVSGSLELRSPIVLDLVSNVFGIEADSPIDRMQFLVFLDGAYVSQTDPMPGAIKSESLLSAGVGLRMGLTSHSQFQIDYGYPLLDVDSDVDDENENGALYFSGQLQF